MSKSKAKARKVRKVVKGPQLPLKLTRAKGEPPRTARMRFVEPPTKVMGNPFFALRVPRDLLRAFKAHAAKRKVHPNELVKGFMSKVTGVEVEAGADD